MSIDPIADIRARAHVHDEYCFGPYVPCGEHHVHDDLCGSRRMYCRRQEEPGLVEFVEYVDQLQADLRTAIAVRDDARAASQRDLEARRAIAAARDRACDLAARSHPDAFDRAELEELRKVGA